MPYPAYMRLTYKGQVEETALTVCGESNLVQINEFRWEIGHEIVQGFRYSEWNAVHFPFKVIIDVNHLLPLLYRVKVSCDKLQFDSIEIFWVEYNPKDSKDTIYFKHSFNPVRIWNIRLFYDNVKSLDFEQNGHLVEIDFRYRFVTATYVNGFLQAGAFEWKYWYTEFGNHGTINPKEAERLLTCSAATDTALDEVEAYFAQQNAPPPEPAERIIEEFALPISF